MKAIGRKGGSRSPMTKLRREAGQDDGLREQAREVLSRALAGEQVDKAQLDAARSLFAFRATASAAPANQEGGRMAFALGDLVKAAAELRVLTGSDLRVGGLSVEADAAARQRQEQPGPGHDAR